MKAGKATLTYAAHHPDTAANEPSARPATTRVQSMSSSNIALLGAVAGFTIYLGLPVGRLRTPLPRLRAMLNATAIGILLFLFFDVLKHAWDPIDKAFADQRHPVGRGLRYGPVLIGCFACTMIGPPPFD